MSPSQVSKSRRAKAPRRGEEVLAAAAHVFWQRGYADATVQDVADELGILKGSVYYYIDSKEDLLFRLLNDTHADIERLLEQVAALKDLSPLAQLREYARGQVEYSCEHVETMAVYHRDIDRLSDDRRREIYRKRAVHEHFVLGLIEAAQAQGEAYGGVDPRVLMNCLFGSLVSVYRWYRPGESPTAASVADACADFVLLGVAG